MELWIGLCALAVFAFYFKDKSDKERLRLKAQEQAERERLSVIQTGNLKEELENSCRQLPMTIKALSQYLAKEKYFSHSDWEQLELTQKKLSAILDKFPYADLTRLVSGSESVQILVKFLLHIDNSHLPTSRDSYNQQAEKKLLETWKDFFNYCESNPLTEAQRIACINDDNNTLVVAGAGSGKTSTIISKCLYLIEAKLARADQILLLAYNHDAAEEMKNRIGNRLKNQSVEVMTFHSFGNNFLKKDEGWGARVTSFYEQKDQFEEFVVSIVQHKAKQCPLYKKKLISFFQNYQVPLCIESSFQDVQAYTAFKNSHDLKTFAKEHVKSAGELIIANLLYRWRIPYAYEDRYPYIRGYKPDFIVTNKPFLKTNTNDFRNRTFSNIQEGARTAWIEYFGIDCQGNVAPYIDREEYLQSRDWKRNIHRKYSTDLIELTTADLQTGQLEIKLRSSLEALGFSINPMSDEEFLDSLWKINQPLHPKWVNFVELVRAFLPLYKDSGYLKEEVFSRAEQANLDVKRIEAFFDIFQPIIDEYESFKKERGEIDFSDMIVQACQLIKQKKIKLPYKYILVDEFQDISHSRSVLLHTILNGSKNAKLFAVGDDWQSIYRFSGSDLNLFVNFQKKYPNSSILQLDRTYRFSDKLHSLSANFVTKNPLQIKKIMSSQIHVEKPSAVAVDVRAVALKLEDGNKLEITQELLNPEECYLKTLYVWLHKIEKKALDRTDKTCTVMLLGRRKWENMPALSKVSLEKLQKDFSSIEVSYKTVHAAKGLEADYVLLIGVDNQIFPSEKQGDQIIEAILPLLEQYPYAEERRLFYVGLTRARRYLIILYDSLSISPFITELVRESVPKLLSAVHDFQSEIVCPHCLEGRLILKESSKGRYYQCSNSHCRELFSSCIKCSAPIVEDHEGRYCVNEDCDFVELRCRSCGFGFMKKRTNRKTKTQFYGCSEWSDDGPSCRYTLRESIAERDLKVYELKIRPQRKKIEVMSLLSKRFDTGL